MSIFITTQIIQRQMKETNEKKAPLSGVGEHTTKPTNQRTPARAKGKLLLKFWKNQAV